MKKIALVSIVLLALALPVSAQVGDVNEDGGTNIVDALFIAQYTVGVRSLSSQQLAAADTNGDGIVNIIDAIFIAQYTVGLRLLGIGVPLTFTAVATGDPVSVGSISLLSGSTGTVSIDVTSVTTDIAAATVTLFFNPAVITVSTVTAGDLGAPIVNINNAAGKVMISAFTVTSQTAAPVTIANVVLAANANAQAGTYPLNLTVQALSDSNGIDRTPGPGGITNGTVTIPRISPDTLLFEPNTWNLVSVPKTLNDSAVDTAFSNLSTDPYNVKWYYNASINAWERPSNISPLRGYWVYNNASTQVTQKLWYKSMTGPNVPPSMVLKAGWNLIGHTSTSAMPVASALVSIEGKYSHLLTYDPIKGWKMYIVGNPALQQFNIFEPGRGYWIFMTQDATYAAVDI